MAQLQQGGMVSQGWLVDSFNRMMEHLDTPSKLIYGVLIVLMIAFSSEIPKNYRTFADSILGRILGIVVIYGVLETMGWVYALLTAMAFLLLLTTAPRVSLEGFDGGGTVTEKKATGKRWFVEKVLGENPAKIATDKVITQSIAN
jgi:hypothetical protein